VTNAPPGRPVDSHTPLKAGEEPDQQKKGSGEDK